MKEPDSSNKETPMRSCRDRAGGQPPIASLTIRKPGRESISQIHAIVQNPGDLDDSLGSNAIHQKMSRFFRTVCQWPNVVPAVI